MKVRIIKANGVKEFNKGIDLEEFNKLILQNIDHSTETNDTTGCFTSYTDTGTTEVNYSYSSSTGDGFFAHIYSAT